MGKPRETYHYHCVACYRERGEIAPKGPYQVAGLCMRHYWDPAPDAEKPALAPDSAPEGT